MTARLLLSALLAALLTCPASAQDTGVLHQSLQAPVAHANKPLRITPAVKPRARKPVTALPVPPPFHPGDLTADQVRDLLAAAGVNPGTQRDLGAPYGTQQLTSVTVSPGNASGEFVVRIRVRRVP